MKKIILTLIFILFFPFALLADNVNIFVSPSGSDLNNGSKNEPLLTLFRAQELVQELIKQGESNITVNLREGRYQMDKTLVLSFEDVPENGSVTWQAYNNEEAILSAGKNITGWRKVQDYPQYTPEQTKGNLYEADLPDGLGLFKTLFDNTTRLERSRCEEYIMDGIPYDVVRRSDSQNVYYNKDRVYLRYFPFTDQIKQWDNLGDVEAFFNPVPWALNFIALSSVDMEKKVAYLKYEANASPFSRAPQARGWVENVIDYLDQPGEWCVNTKTKKIYYWPEDGKPSDQIFAPQLMEMIRVEGKIQYDMQTDIPVKNIHFKGLTFMHGDRSEWYKDRKGWGIQHDWDTFDYGNALLRFRGAQDCSVTECHFTASGGSAMRLDLYAQNISISENLIDYVGHMGILLAGYGPGTKDVNKNNEISNNIIHHCGEVVWHGHAIFAWQSGENKITHNYIHDVPRKAIGICGVRCQILMKPECNFDEASRTIRWHEIEATIDSTQEIIQRYAPYLHARNNLIEDNRIERTLLKLHDGSSINISGAGLGNVVQHNYLYDIPFVGIRTDDWQDGTTIQNNLLHKVNQIGIIHKGVNDIRNNILINCVKFLHFRAYPQQYFVAESDVTNNIFFTEATQYQPSTVYQWANMNVHRGGEKPLPYEFNVDYNSYYSTPSDQKIEVTDWVSNAVEDLALKQSNGIEEHGVIMNPHFADIEHKNYEIRNKELIEAINFEVFDTNIKTYGVTTKYPDKFKKLDGTL